jgi:hypothetical protein
MLKRKNTTEKIKGLWKSGQASAIIFQRNSTYMIRIPYLKKPVPARRNRKWLNSWYSSLSFL